MTFVQKEFNRRSQWNWIVYCQVSWTFVYHNCLFFSSIITESVGLAICLVCLVQLSLSLSLSLSRLLAVFLLLILRPQPVLDIINLASSCLSILHRTDACKRPTSILNRTQELLYYPRMHINSTFDFFPIEFWCTIWSDSVISICHYAWYRLLWLWGATVCPRAMHVWTSCSQNRFSNKYVHITLALHEIL